MRAVLSRGDALDTDTTYTLLEGKGFLDTVEVDDNGAVEGMDDALERCVARYPG